MNIEKPVMSCASIINADINVRVKIVTDYINELHAFSGSTTSLSDYARDFVIMNWTLLPGGVPTQIWNLIIGTDTFGKR